MPTLSITVTAEQATRVAAALKDEAAGAEAQEKASVEAGGGTYTQPTDKQRFERWLMTGLKTTVLNHERRKALAALETTLNKEL